MTSGSCPQIHRPVALKAFIRHLTIGIRRWFAFLGLVHTAGVVVYCVDTIMTLKIFERHSSNNCLIGFVFSITDIFWQCYISTRMLIAKERQLRMGRSISEWHTPNLNWVMKLSERLQSHQLMVSYLLRLFCVLILLLLLLVMSFIFYIYVHAGEWGSFCFVGYVQAIREELFSVTTKSQLQSYKIVAERYKTKVPPSLSSQFKERVTKPEAVNKYKERQKRASTHLYPSGKLSQSSNNKTAKSSTSMQYNVGLPGLEVQQWSNNNYHRVLNLIV